MPKIDVAGLALHYVEEGQGTPLFQLHGNPGSWRVWRKVLPELRRRHHVFARDRQGFGDSEEGETGDYGPRGYARELLGVMDALAVTAPMSAASPWAA